MSNHQSAYMLESSYGYLLSAKLLWDNPATFKVACVNASIGIEILLKSFIAEPVQDQWVGTEAERYEGKREHNLLKLVKKVDPVLSKEFGFDSHIDTLEKYGMLFIQSRYPYEKSAPSSYNETLIWTGIDMFKSVINWYKKQGMKILGLQITQMYRVMGYDKAIKLN